MLDNKFFSPNEQPAPSPLETPGISSLTARLRSLTHEDEAIVLKIMSSLLISAGHTEPKAQALLQMLFTYYVRDHVREDGTYTITRGELAGHLAANPNGLRQTLTRIRNTQDERQIRLIQMDAFSYLVDGRWRRDGITFNLTDFLGLWEDIRELAFADPQFEDEPYKAIDRAAVARLGRCTWKPTTINRQGQSRESWIQEQVTRIRTRAKFEQSQENIHSQMELHLAAIRAAYEELLAEAESADPRQHPKRNP